MKIFLVAGEHSGDQLGYKLMQAMRAQADESLEFIGVGGEAMIREGLSSLFPLEDIAVMGFMPVIARLPKLLSRIRQTADAVIAAKPDVLVLIDSPDFTHRVARRARKVLPALKVVDYVSPTVWAWRPGRARKMRGYIDHVLALLPFEPAAHLRLGGPDCTYVGHPLIERLAELRPNGKEIARRAGKPPILLVLPGSRRSEIERLMPLFGAVLAQMTQTLGPVEAVLPAVPHLEGQIRQQLAIWPVKPRLVVSEAEKLLAFRQAHAALAASGTVTLELALAKVPMVVGYKVGHLESLLRYVITAPSIVLPNLILESRAIPEFVQENCTLANITRALMSIMNQGVERDFQVDALENLDARMRLPGGIAPSAMAAGIVLQQARWSSFPLPASRHG